MPTQRRAAGSSGARSGSTPATGIGIATGYQGRHDRSGGAEAARGRLLPGLVAGPASAGRAGAGHGDRPGLHRGVSTRRVDDLVRAMGIDGISASQVSRMAAELDANALTQRSARAA